MDYAALTNEIYSQYLVPGVEPLTLEAIVKTLPLTLLTLAFFIVIGPRSAISQQLPGLKQQTPAMTLKNSRTAQIQCYTCDNPGHIPCGTPGRFSGSCCPPAYPWLCDNKCVRANDPCPNKIVCGLLPKC